jgi:hypothetical protein
MNALSATELMYSSSFLNSFCMKLTFFKIKHHSREQVASEFSALFENYASGPEVFCFHKHLSSVFRELEPPIQSLIFFFPPSILLDMNLSVLPATELTLLISNFPKSYTIFHDGLQNVTLGVLSRHLCLWFWHSELLVRKWIDDYPFLSISPKSFARVFLMNP